MGWINDKRRRVIYLGTMMYHLLMYAHQFMAHQPISTTVPSGENDVAHMHSPEANAVDFVGNNLDRISLKRKHSLG